MLECRVNGFVVLNGEIVVTQQDADGGRDLLCSTLVHCIENPDGLGENKMRNPGAGADESFSGDLLMVLAPKQADQNIRVHSGQACLGH